ncbi:methyltransferase family protein [Methylotenera mobilis]
MRKIGTSGNPRETSTALAINGPFRISRNPIYLAMTGMYLGISFFTNSLWSLVLLVPLLSVMHWGVIFREERYLAKQFGQAYLEYKSMVPRWL